jgi:hypothetical protein
MRVDLPAGWNGRIVLGAEGSPVLHAAPYPLPENDDDSGEVARESIGTAQAIYLNVRNLGAGGSPLTLPVAFSASDFAAPPAGPGSLCCKITEATREGAVDGGLFRITAVSGGNEPPSAGVLAEANDVLRTLDLAHYVRATVPALPADAERIEGHGVSMRLPAGWTGHAGRGELDAGSGEISLKLLEHGSPDGFVTGRTPIELSATEFLPPQGGSDPAVPASTGRSFVDHGRHFVLWVEARSLPPTAEALEQANEALSTLNVEPGDFYPGTVDPATFTARACECRARATHAAGLELSRWLGRARDPARTGAARATRAPRAGGRARA